MALQRRMRPRVGLQTTHVMSLSCLKAWSICNDQLNMYIYSQGLYWILKIRNETKSFRNWQIKLHLQMLVYHCVVFKCMAAGATGANGVPAARHAETEVVQAAVAAAIHFHNSAATIAPVIRFSWKVATCKSAQVRLFLPKSTQIFPKITILSSPVLLHFSNKWEIV